MTAIRLLGHHHTSHHHGAVLDIADEAVVRNNPASVITLSRARELVERGQAEWVGEPAVEQEPQPEQGAEHSGQISHSDGEGDDGDDGED